MDFLKAKQACVYILSGELNGSSVQLLHLLAPWLDYKICKGNNIGIKHIIKQIFYCLHHQLLLIIKHFIK